MPVRYMRVQTYFYGFWICQPCQGLQDRRQKSGVLSVVASGAQCVDLDEAEDSFSTFCVSALQYPPSPQ